MPFVVAGPLAARHMCVGSCEFSAGLFTTWAHGTQTRGSEPGSIRKSRCAVLGFLRLVGGKGQHDQAPAVEQQLDREEQSQYPQARSGELRIDQDPQHSR